MKQIILKKFAVATILVAAVAFILPAGARTGAPKVTPPATTENPGVNGSQTAATSISDQLSPGV